MDYQKVARMNLYFRDHGYSIAFHFRRVTPWYAIIVALCVAAGYLFHRIGAEYGTYILVGMVLGMVCRDLGWTRRMKQNWPFSREVIDWEKVKVVAEGTYTISS